MKAEGREAQHDSRTDLSDLMLSAMLLAMSDFHLGSAIGAVISSVLRVGSCLVMAVGRVVGVD